MPRHKHVGVKRSTRGDRLDPACGRSVFLNMDDREWRVGRNDVACEDDLFRRQINYQVATGMRGRDVEEMEFLAVDDDVFLGVDSFCGQWNFHGRRASRGTLWRRI